MRAGAGVARSGLGDVPKAAAASLGAQCASAASLTMSEPVLVTASDADSVRSAVTAFAATAALPGVRQFAVFMPPLMLVWRCATACCVHATLDACVEVWGSFAVIMPPLMLVSRCGAACGVHATPILMLVYNQDHRTWLSPPKSGTSAAAPSRELVAFCCFRLVVT